MARKRIVIVAVVAALALVLADAALTDNYRFQRTAQDDAQAAAIVLKRSDFPSGWTLKGGRVKPDETAGNASKQCSYEGSDLAVTGDAESSYSDRAAGVVISSQASVFRTVAMAAADWKRGSPTMTFACMQESAKAQTPSLSLVSMTKLPSLRCGFQNVSFALEVLNRSSGKPSVDLVSVMTVLRRGRTEVFVYTFVRKQDARSVTTARDIQAFLLGTVRPRITAT